MLVSQTEDHEQSVRFLLEQFKQIDAERMRLRGEAVQRLNFFLTLTSAILGGLVLLGSPNNSARTDYISLAALTFLSIIGWYTFHYIVSRDINTDSLLRANGRIRRYFVDRDESIQDYLIWQAHDEPTPYITKNNSTIRRTVQAVLSFLLAFTVSLLTSLSGRTAVVTVMVGIGAFLLLLVGLELYAAKLFRNAVKQAHLQVKFARSSPPSTPRDIPSSADAKPSQS